MKALLVLSVLAVAHGEAPHAARAVVKRPALQSSTKKAQQRSTLVAAGSAARGLTAAKEKAKLTAAKGADGASRPSFKWAMLHNWLYFLALGLSIPVLPRVISTIVNTDGSPDVTPASSILSGDVEAVDKIITFMCVGLLGALSDVIGRKPLLAYSALGFAITCYLQAQCVKTTGVLYLADFVDGGQREACRIALLTSDRLFPTAFPSHVSHSRSPQLALPRLPTLTLLLHG